MKKFLALLLCLAMVFCFAACGGDTVGTRAAVTDRVEARAREERARAARARGNAGRNARPYLAFR